MTKYFWMSALCALTITGCGNEAPAAPGAPVAQAQPTAQPAAPGAIAIGGAPSTIQVVSPELALNITEAAEYQIDATSTLDVKVWVFSGDRQIAMNDDGGEGNNAQIIEFLAPGNYALRTAEYRGRTMTAQVAVQRLAPLTPTGVIAPGQSISAVTPRGANNRAASLEYTLNITAPGTYQIDAVSADKDAQLVLTQNGRLIAKDSDSGDGRNARLRQNLAPGAYTVRIHDWIRREANITLSVAQQ